MEKCTTENKTQIIKKSTDEGLHAGHRQRMYAKLNRGELCEHELLETLLFFAIPRVNTNELAHRLLRRFGTIADVLNATADELAQVKGMGVNSAAFLQCIGVILTDYGTAMKRVFPQRYEPNSFLAFVHEEYKNCDKEVADVYLIRDDSAIYMRRRYQGEEDCVSFPVKWLQKILLDYEPTGIIVVHNHPSGDPTPSTEDKVAAEKCQSTCLGAGVLLCDFCVTAESGAYSFYLSGAMSKIAETCLAMSQRKQPMTNLEE